MNRTTVSRRLLLALPLVIALGACTDSTDPSSPDGGAQLDVALRDYLRELGFTGRIESTLEAKLGRGVDQQLADIGRLLWFDPIQGLNDDNTCAGCHSPTNGFGDTQPIAIGIDNNGIVGPDRAGPRNQRRSPMTINTAFYPTLMWNSRFFARSRDPFDNGEGFVFPDPEATSLSYLPHLLTAQAFIPPTERVEAAGFHFPGDNDAIRAEVLHRLNENETYRAMFGDVFPEVKAGGAITFVHFARAIAEFEFTQVFADAPIDRFARGDEAAMTESQKRGAVLFFGEAKCVRCHAVSGESNEMFSDFHEYVAGIPQVMPLATNMEFDGPGANEDFGLEQATERPEDRYRFRTSPLRNVALQTAFMHNGAFTTLEDAIRYHMDPLGQAGSYSTAHLPADLRGPPGPMQPVLARLDERLRSPVRLTDEEFEALVDFVRNGLLDPDARPERLRHFIPSELPSGRTPLIFR